jgi:hypothetical protein
MENPLQLYFTSLAGNSLDEMKKHQGYSNWDVWAMQFISIYLVN